MKETNQNTIEQVAKEINVLLNKPEVKSVVDKNCRQHEKIIRLHELNLTHKQISIILGCTPRNVSRGIWMYNKGHKQKPVE